MIDTVLMVFNVAVKHRGIRFQTRPVYRFHDLEPTGARDLLGTDCVSDPDIKYFLIDFNGGKSLYMNVREPVSEGR
jgi:hypothetical protein